MAFQTPPGSQASPRGQAKDAALLSSHDADLLEPTEWRQGSQAFSSVWREDSGLCSGSGRKRRLSPREDGGFSGVSSSCGARGGFLTKQDEDLREPLVRCQGSQVSVRVASGSASWLSSQWERTRASRRVEEGHSRSFWGCGGKASFPSTSAGHLRELPMVPLIGEGCCGLGGASRDSAGLGAMEEVLISWGGKNLRLPLRFGLRPQGPCRVGTGESGLVLSEEGNPACLSSCSGGHRPLVELCVEPAGVSGRCTGMSVPLRSVPSPTGLPSKRVRHRVLLKSGPGNRGRSACGTTHVAHFKCPRETGLLLRCAGKAGNPFQTTQGNRLSCRDQEGRRGSDEAVPGPSVFHSRELGVSGKFWGRMKAVRSRFALQVGTGDFP